MTSVRLFISLPASQHWPLHQLDIKSALLHGDLQEEVYMEQPPGFVAQGEYGKVCHLKKFLYSLRQSPCAWFDKFSEVQKFGLRKGQCDHLVFYRNSDISIILLVVYVDDIVITGNDSTGISSLKNYLHASFHTKDLGQLKYFLGVEILRSKRGILLSHRNYVLDLLAETGKIGAKPCSTSMIPNICLTKDDGDPYDNLERYRSLVGKLNYLMVMTRLDIAFAVSVVRQFIPALTVKHWAALEQILCYRKGTPRLGILYKDYGHAALECFSDVDWVEFKSDRRSITGYCVFIGGNLVSWKSKKQNVVSRSSAESKYRAIAQSTCEILWINYLLKEVGMMLHHPRNFGVIIRLLFTLLSIQYTMNGLSILK
ncbi:uncharacterized protein LOC110624931 isoform X1 [Manihot esculenta]|uniref:uncharacterized protein LOC110624931 isoform X1 n=1 Tax=Manihot esculenta TaxID=3983 RepID=UPI001CC599D8|nr:uncharacterized protein LOC110624931 isoform X1 [Manihot esculenta]XP_043816781.1 uncharacterized protein LOC110624931 isoform X1 [Manihot esculenta]